MGKKGGGDDVAAQARADELARQKRIREGTARINEIFDGGYGTGAVGADAVYDPTKTYYLADGSVWTPPAASTGASTGGKTTQASFGFGLNNNASGGKGYVAGAGGDKSLYGAGGGDQPTGVFNVFGDMLNGVFKNAAAGKGQDFASMVKSGKLFTGKATGFDDNFYNARKQSYLDYALPQINDQYDEANRQLTYALDRGGNLDSSVRGAKSAELQKLYDKNMQQASDQALSYQNQAKTGVEDARQNLIATLNATGDAQGAANSALARSQTLAQAPTYSPLANLFTDFTNALGWQAAQERAQAASNGAYKSPYNTGLFGNSGSVKVT